MRAAIVLLALFDAAFAMPKQPQRIIGGSPTTVQEYPFITNQIFDLWGTFWVRAGGGTLITNTVVVTAAHCVVSGDPLSAWRVRLGSSFASSGGVEHYVSKITLHPDYVYETSDSDVALIHLSQPAVLSASVQTASIAGPKYIPPDGSIVTALGWGALSPDGSNHAEQLHHVDVNVINQELCAERYAYLKTQPGFAHYPDITPGMVCAGILDVGGKDACTADSGGPLMHMNVLVGIISWGYGCADPFYPGVYARVSQFSNWIVANA